MNNLIYKPIEQYDKERSPEVLLVKGGYHIGIGSWNSFAEAWQVGSWGIIDRNCYRDNHKPVFIPDGFYELNQADTIFGYDELFGWTR